MPFSDTTRHDIDDAGDDIFVDENFGSTSVTASHDHAGNMIDDGTFRYVYDAWNRLVTVKSSKDSGATTVQTAEFDGIGRRLKKLVTDSGDYDGTVVYLFDGQKIIETRDGSNNVVQQFIHGTRYIDELVMMRVIDKGDLYIHQDANWNVIALTDLGGHVVERYVYTPYGEITVHAETGYGDRDGDQDVDATDKGTPGSTCTGTVTGACRILDLDFDGDYDATDASKFDNLPQGIARHPGRVATAVGQPFGHQGLLYEPELGQYQNRARQYDPGKRRFVQRDPLCMRPTARSAYQDGMNSYAYVNSAPIVRVDPLGLRGCGGWICKCEVTHPNDLTPPNTCTGPSKQYVGTCAYRPWTWKPFGCCGAWVTCSCKWVCEETTWGWRWQEAGGANCN